MLEGELFISIDDAGEYAGKYKVPLKDELIRLVIHGFLHLVGYDDRSPGDKRKMKQVENSLLNKYFSRLNL